MEVLLHGVLQNFLERYNASVHINSKIRNLVFSGFYTPYLFYEKGIEVNMSEKGSEPVKKESRGIRGWIQLMSEDENAPDISLLEELNVYCMDRYFASYTPFTSGRYEYGMRVWLYLDDFPEELSDIHSNWESIFTAHSKNAMLERLNGKTNFDLVDPYNLKISFRGRAAHSTLRLSI